MTVAHCIRSSDGYGWRTALCSGKVKNMVLLMTPTQFHDVPQAERCARCHNEFQRLMQLGKYQWNEGENGKRELHRR